MQRRVQIVVSHAAGFWISERSASSQRTKVSCTASSASLLDPSMR
jgi:hypothetical protein